MKTETGLDRVVKALVQKLGQDPDAVYIWLAPGEIPSEWHSPDFVPSEEDVAWLVVEWREWSGEPLGLADCPECGGNNALLPCGLCRGYGGVPPEVAERRAPSVEERRASHD